MVTENALGSSSTQQDSFAQKYLVCAVQTNGQVQWIGGYKLASDARRCRDGLSDAVVIQHDEDGVDLEWGKRTPNKDRDRLAKKVMAAYHKRKHEIEHPAPVSKTFWSYTKAGNCLGERTSASIAIDLMQSSPYGACVVNDQGTIVRWCEDLTAAEQREYEPAIIAAWNGRNLSHLPDNNAANDNSDPPDPPPHLNAINPPPPLAAMDEQEVSPGTIPDALPPAVQEIVDQSRRVQTGGILPEQHDGALSEVLAALDGLKTTPVNQLERNIIRVCSRVTSEFDQLIRKVQALQTEVLRLEQQIKEHGDYITDLQETNARQEQICSDLTAIIVAVDAVKTKVGGK